jgi:hypothetical protein
MKKWTARTERRVLAVSEGRLGSSRKGIAHSPRTIEIGGVLPHWA